MGAGNRVRVVTRFVLGGAAVVAAAWACGALLGFGGFAFAWVTHFLLMAWISGVLDALRPRLDGPRSRAWFRVRPWEGPLYRRLGVTAYGRLLRRAGWERVGVRPSFDGTRASLVALERRTRTSEAAHLVVGAIGAGLVLVAAGLRAWEALAWLLALDVVLHAYPVMLQRSVRGRIGRVLRAVRPGDREHTERPEGWRGYPPGVS